MNKLKAIVLSLTLGAGGTSVLYGQTSLSKIVVDGIPFVDMNGNGKLEIYEDTRLPNYKRIDDLMARLSIEDKINLVLGTGMSGFEMISGFEQIDPGIDTKGFMLPGAAGTTTPLPQFGIPAVVMTDGPAGVRISPTRKNDNNTYYATGFPIGSLLACTWDVDLVKSVGRAMGNEALEYGSDIQLAPALNIMRNPLCGRNYEYYSEDPVLSGKIAAAATLGIQANGVGASLKHYVANNSEKNRMSLDVNISQRTLREIYLRGFEIAVKESNPATIMSSYNKLNGVYTSASRDLLTTILRDEWGFKGLVMTDWFGGYGDVSNLFSNTSNKIGFTENYTSEQIKAGNDLLMPGTRFQISNLKKDLTAGILSEKDLDISVKRVLEMVFSSPKMQGYKYSNKPDLKEHALLTRKVAPEGMILLENKNNTLPLTTDMKKLSVFGSLSYQFVANGTGSGGVNTAYTVSLIEGLNNAGYTLDTKLLDIYTKFTDKEKGKVSAQLKKYPLMLIPLMPQPVLKDALVKQNAKENDIAIITIGRSSGELDDRKVTDDFNLTEKENQLIDQVSTHFHEQGKKVVVVINVGGPIETVSWKNKVDAILLAWLPGQEAGNSVTDILSGKVNPSGKLAMTFPLKYEDVSSADNFQGTPADDPKEVTYKEGIYVGYRYFDTFQIPTSYEFGYGLSYTQFEYSNLKLSAPSFNDELFVSVDVKNTGQTAGKEVVQLYLNAPKGSIDKPVKELKAFAKTKLLQPGETQTIMMRLVPKDLASFYESASAWVADKGTYKVLLGASSQKIKQTTTFELKETRTVEKVNNVMKPRIIFTDMSVR